METAPLVLLLRSLDTPTRSMTLPYHAQVLARHYADKSQRLDDLTTLAEHLVGGIQNGEDARQSLEWMALRLPVKGALAQQHDCDELSIECGERIERMVLALSQRVDLSMPIADDLVRAGLDNPHIPLGSVLLALGHEIELGKIDLDPAGIPMMASTAIDHGNYARANQLLAMFPKHRREELIDTIWMSVARLRTGTSMDGIEVLPDPPSQWWSDVQGSKLAVSGDRIAQRVLLDRPHLLCEYVAGVTNHGDLSKVHPAMLGSAWQMQTQWQSVEGWKGSPLAVLAARAGDEENPWAKHIGEIAASAATALKGPDPGPLPNDYIMRLISAAATSEQLTQLPTDFVEAWKMAGEKKPKECLDGLKARWVDYPRGRYGALSAGLCVLTGRAMSKWVSQSAQPSQLASMARNAYTHADLLQALEWDDQDTVEAHARSIRLLFTNCPNFKVQATSSMSQIHKNEQLEYMLWNFASDRLGRRAKDHAKKINIDKLSPRQSSMISSIEALMDAGATLHWPADAGSIAMRLLSNQFTQTPDDLLARLQHCVLDTSPGPTLTRRGARL